MSSVIIYNRQARYNYEIFEKLEAGIELKGFEVKSILTGGVSLKGVYAAIRSGEVWLLNLDIPPYQPKNMPEDYNPKRSRRLLLKQNEIKHLIGRTREKGLTLIPLKVYTKRGKIKVNIGLGKAKKKEDKREEIKKRDIERDIRKHL